MSPRNFGFDYNDLIDKGSSARPKGIFQAELIRDTEGRSKEAESKQKENKKKFFKALYSKFPTWRATKTSDIISILEETGLLRYSKGRGKDKSKKEPNMAASLAQIFGPGTTATGLLSMLYELEYMKDKIKNYAPGCIDKLEQK